VTALPRACRRFVQYKVLLTRYFKAYWRSPPYNTTRLILNVIAALIIGTAYWSRGNNYGSTADVTAVLGALFISVMFVGFVNFQMIIPTFFMERPVMWRERASRLYAVLPWAQAMEDVEIPWIMAQTMLFSIISYWMVHFEVPCSCFSFTLACSMSSAKRTDLCLLPDLSVNLRQCMCYVSKSALPAVLHA
jgi:ABC-type multidrug transport system permease subunit